MWPAAFGRVLSPGGRAGAVLAVVGRELDQQHPEKFLHESRFFESLARSWLLRFVASAWTWRSRAWLVAGHPTHAAHPPSRPTHPTNLQRTIVFSIHPNLRACVFKNMVNLTITPAIIEGLQLRSEVAKTERGLQRNMDDPLLDEASLGDPISHGQIIDLWAALRAAGRREYSLENLLKGSRVYVSPPPPKPQPVSPVPQCHRLSVLTSEVSPMSSKP